MAGLKQIRLEKWKTVKDANGNNIESVVKYNYWADVRLLGGSRSSYSGKSELGNQVEFTIDFKPNRFPTGNWRVVYQGKRYKVLSIERSDRFKWIITADGKS
jgi:SPP1 family predicted phage head-tail adaptor